MKKNSILYILCILFTVSCSNKKAEEQGAEDIDLIPVQKSGEYLYIDKNGKEIIPAQFTEASIFREGVALVKDIEGLYGYINLKGEYIIPPKYKFATSFSEGIAFVTLPEGKVKAINLKGEEAFVCPDADFFMPFYGNYAAYSINGKTKLIDKTGKTTLNIDCKCELLFFGHHEYLVVYKDSNNGDGSETELYGLMNTSGKMVVDFQYDHISPFIKTFKIAKNDKYGIIDNNGKILINPEFDDIVYDKGLYLIKKGSKYGWCDETGKIMINPQFEGASNFEGNEYAGVKINEDGWGFINKKGDIVIKPQFKEVLPFIDNVAFAKNYNNKWGIIDKTGNYIAKPQFDFILCYGNNIIFAEMGEKWGLIDKKGNYLTNFIYNEIGEDMHNGFNNSILYNYAGNDSSDAEKESR